MGRQISPEVMAAINDVERGMPVQTAAALHGVNSSGLYQRVNRLGVVYVGQARGRRAAKASPLRREKARLAVLAAGVPLFRATLDLVLAVMEDDVPAEAAVQLLIERGDLTLPRRSA